MRGGRSVRQPLPLTGKTPTWRAPRQSTLGQCSWQSPRALQNRSGHALSALSGLGAQADVERGCLAAPHQNLGEEADESYLPDLDAVAPLGCVDDEAILPGGAPPRLPID